MNILDWTLIIILVFGVLRGLLRGAISQIFGAAGLLGGFLLASHSYQNLALRIVQVFPSLPQPQVAGFLAIFVLTWFCLSCVGYWFGFLFRRAGLGFFDRVLGVGVGAGKALIMAVVLISSLTFLLPAQSEILRGSRFAPYVQVAAQQLVKATPFKVQELFERKHQDLKRFWKSPKEASLNLPLKRKISA